MALCPVNLIDSNVTGLWVAEEECPRELPATPDWYAQEPNSYNNFGGTIETIQREFIDPGRQNQKGTPVNHEAAGGFNTDLTKSNLTRLLQGFFFADAREGASTKSINGTAVPITEVTVLGGAVDFEAASGMGVFSQSNLVLADGFRSPANNKVHVIALASTSAIRIRTTTVSGVDEASPPATAKIDSVGVQFAEADLAFSYVGGVAAIVATAYVFTDNAELFPGQWIFLGGDATANRFADNVGYARIKSIVAKTIIFSETTWLPETEAGTGKTIRMFIPVTVKNENVPNLIKKRTYQLERTLGLSSEGLVQAEYIEGCIANEFNVSIPVGDKITSDLNYQAVRATEKLGIDPDFRKTGNRHDSPKQRSINTSTDVYRMQLSLLGSTSFPEPFFAYVTEGSLSINNNATSHKAIGLLGALENTVGTFNVTGSITAFFVSTSAKRAMRTLEDASLNFILAQDNAGVILDIPLVSLSGGEIAVEKDAPIMIPVELMGSENELGYTASYSSFKYLPDIAMPTVNE